MAETKRIVYIDSWGDLIGGGQHSLLDMLKHAGRLNAVPSLICGTGGALIEAAESAAIPSGILSMPPLARVSESLETVRELRAELKRVRPDLIHANSMRAGLYALLASGSLHIPVVNHARVFRSGTLRDYVWDRYMARQSAAIIANSNAVAGRFAWGRKSKKVHVVYNGIDAEDFREPCGGMLRQHWGVAPDAFLIGLIGMIDPRKGHEVLLRALPEIVEANPGAEIVFAGRIPDAHQSYARSLKASIEAQGFGRRIHWVGRVESIPSLMHAIDLCVLPVVKPEGFGRVVIEAAAAGKTTVASRLPALDETVRHGETGLLVEHANAKALAEAVIVLSLDSEKRERLGGAARDWACETFSMEKMLQGIRKVYESIGKHAT